MPETLPEPGSFAAKVQALDRALTGCNDQRAAHTYRDNGDKTPEQWVFTSDAYYLSDGGYSRVRAGLESSEIFLTSNSRSEVKARWSACATEIAAVEQELREYLTSLSE